MKKIAFITLAMVASTSVFAQVTSGAVCGGTAGDGTAVASDTTGSYLVRVGFTPKCSANVLLNFNQNATAAWVASGSQKGRSTFIGSSNGGGVVKSGTCPNAGCTTTEIGTALTAAAAIGGSS